MNAWCLELDQKSVRFRLVVVTADGKHQRDISGRLAGTAQKLALEADGGFRRVDQSGRRTLTSDEDCTDATRLLVQQILKKNRKIGILSSVELYGPRQL